MVRYDFPSQIVARCVPFPTGRQTHLVSGYTYSIGAVVERVIFAADGVGYEAARFPQGSISTLPDCFLQANS